MSGTLFGLGLSQNVDINGRPLSGALLYIYAASTTTPVQVFSDFGLSVLTQWPLEADSSGRIPAFWVADGSYRARLTTSSGTEVFDLDGIQAIGASSSTGGGGGGGGSNVDATALAQTGDPLWIPVASIARAGWIRMNARTFGSASSGAVERANADTQPLYEYLWANFSNTLCPVTGGRGGTAVADFNANKPMATLDMRGRGPFGLDTMGNSAAGILVTGTPTAAASATGAEKATVSIAQANLPSYNLSAASLTGSVGTTITNGAGLVQGGSLNGQAATGSGGQDFAKSNVSVTASLASGTVTFGGTIPSGGSGTALTPTTISPGRLGTWYIKL